MASSSLNSKISIQQMQLLSPDATPLSRPEDALPSPLQQHLSLQQFENVITQLEREDVARDNATQPDANARKARAAVRFAMRSSTQLDAYNVNRVLGFGSNGVVLSGSVNSAPVAVKIIYKSAKAVGTLTDLPNEVKVLQHLSSVAAPQQQQHNHIITFLASWQDARHHYLVTDLHGSDWFAPMLADEGNEPQDEDILTFVNPRKVTTLPGSLFDGQSTTATTSVTTEHLRISAGASDLWAWGIGQKYNNMKQVMARGYDPNTLHPTQLPLPSRRRVRQAFLQIASALAHLHSMGIVHADIKEENVLMQAAGTHSQDVSAKLCDFGHAVVGTSTAPILITSYGTPQLTPPELWAARFGKKSSTAVPVDGRKADVFALGVLLFTMSHGPGKVPETLIHVNKANASATSSGLPTTGAFPLHDMDPRIEKECQDLIRWMTAIRPQDRPTMEQVLESDWMDF